MPVPSSGRILLICVLSCLATRTTGVAAQNSLDYVQYARINPLKFVQQLSHLPPQQQRVYLRIIGQGLQQRHSLACNPFGGSASCMSFNGSSTYAEVCGEATAKVDCIYYAEEDFTLDLHSDPTTSLRQAMKDRGVEDLEVACPQCFENLRRFTCAQAVPKCGSFSVTVEKAILPALAAVVQAREDGETHADALSRAMPILLAAFGLAMPCREMCEAVVTSCNCNNDYTFGKLLKAWLDSAKSSSGSAQPLSTDSAASILSNFYDKPLCSMFASRAKAGFSGHCYDLPTACSNPDQWCNGDGGANKDIMVVQELMAAQLATALFGVAGGLFDDEQEMLDTSGNENVTSYIVDAGTGGKEERESNGVIIVLLVIACTALAAVSAWVYIQHKKLRLLRSSNGAGGYVSLGELGSGDVAYEPPRSNS